MAHHTLFNDTLEKACVDSFFSALGMYDGVSASYRPIRFEGPWDQACVGLVGHRSAEVIQQELDLLRMECESAGYVSEELLALEDELEAINYRVSRARAGR